MSGRDKIQKGGRGRVAALLAVVGALALGLPVIALLLNPSDATVKVTVHSDPEGASVFERGRCLGAAPLSVTLSRGELRVFRLVRKGRRDALVTLRGDDYLARARRPRSDGDKGAHVTVPLPGVPNCSLRVTTEPDGAAVFVNGRREGVTPLAREGMSPGVYAIRVAHAEYFPETAQVTLEAGGREHVHRALKSRWVAKYRELIAKEPGNLMHHSDLIHYYVLNGDWDGAAVVIREGSEAVSRSDAQEKNRYYAELQHVYTRYYTYPRTKGANQLREVIREAYKKSLERGARSHRQVQAALKRFDQYDVQHKDEE